MPTTLMRYATPTTIAFFLVSLITGIALFFHVGPSAFHGVHEWLSMVLILPFVLHVWRNWKPMTKYMTGKPLLVSAVVSVLASAIFFLPMGGAGGGRPPVFALSQQVLQHTPAEVAPALGMTADALTAKLTAAGYTVAPDQSLNAIAQGSGKSMMDIAGVLIARDQ
ncbi:DUF4405 domain-containing protein [Rhodovulum adriaticum]|uniref:Uncharacterized protein DUF4405 n=1 Tax=Rhodovulum adriaticum TaxID=35804 RepID=A0A4V6NQG4_RHOAD|nr:DUF4405 domain-containing protein [Rhodovulum adriaticum]MBK1637207.1 DUF4405 domain-containing protein [Rhodovulum adriaticum]TCP21966.1 uncharacterized protein DUF4405 [Rhodovulum adriaticum]